MNKMIIFWLCYFAQLLSFALWLNHENFWSWFGLLNIFTGMLFGASVAMIEGGNGKI